MTRSPREIAVRLQTARQISKDISHVGVPALPESTIDSDPVDVAQQAMERSRLLDPETREQALSELSLVLGDSEVSQRLVSIVKNSSQAVDILSLIGYPALRHLRSQGFSLHRIANDLQLNVADVAAFMNAMPTSAVDTVVDEEAFADALADELYSEMQLAMKDPNLSRNSLELFKVRKDLLIEMAKRSSNRWAQRPAEETKSMPTLHIDLTQSAPVAGPQPRYEDDDDDDVIEGEVEEIPEMGVLEFDDV